MYIIRPYEPDDERTVRSLWKTCLPEEQETVPERILLDARSNAGVSFVTCDRDRIVGFIFASDSARQKLCSCGGRVQVVFVDPSLCRHGIGMGLLSAVARSLRASGGHIIRVGSEAPELIPGVDRDRQQDAMAFFESMGYAEYSDVVTMAMSLESWAMPTAVAEAAESLRASGYRFEWYTELSCIPLMEFVEAHCPQAWADTVRRAVLRNKAGEDILLALDSRGGIAGYCQRCSDGVPSHVGPLGVERRLRGRRIGSVLFSLMVEDMVRRGIQGVSLGWIAVEHDARCFYEQQGMHVVRHYLSLCKALM